jgi:ABC-type nitrate/sulfonate/bicarbonate transport system substrate-binding protein
MSNKWQNVLVGRFTKEREIEKGIPRRSAEITKRNGLVAKLIFAIVLFLFDSAVPVEARKVAVGVPVLDVTQSALYVARDRGYYQKEGLEVDLILMRGGVANQALIAGNVEFTTVPTAGLQAALQGAPLKVVLSTFHKPMFWLYSRAEIRSVKDLSGKKVAVSSLGAAAIRPSAN